MKQLDAFVVALVLLVGATMVSRRYLSRNGQLLLGAIALGAHLA